MNDTGLRNIIRVYSHAADLLQKFVTVPFIEIGLAGSHVHAADILFTCMEQIFSRRNFCNIAVCIYTLRVGSHNRFSTRNHRFHLFPPIPLVNQLQIRVVEIQECSCQFLMGIPYWTGKAWISPKSDANFSKSVAKICVVSTLKLLARQTAV